MLLWDALIKYYAANVCTLREIYFIHRAVMNKFCVQLTTLIIFIHTSLSGTCADSATLDCRYIIE